MSRPDLMPVGTVVPVRADLAIHPGWLIADGRRIKRSDYPELWQVLRNGFHARWLPWRVFLPDFREKNFSSPVVYLIRAQP